MAKKRPVTYEVTATKQSYMGSHAFDTVVRAAISGFGEAEVSRHEQMDSVKRELGVGAGVTGFSMRLMRPAELKALAKRKLTTQPPVLSNGLVVRDSTFEMDVVVPAQDLRRQRVSQWLAGVNAVKDGDFDCFMIQPPGGYDPLLVNSSNVEEVRETFDSLYGHIYPDLFAAYQQPAV